MVQCSIRSFLQHLEANFDFVYSWGVLHHTGDMWKALSNAATKVSIEGTLYISIYNDQGGASKRWLSVKKLYNSLPSVFKPFFAIAVYAPLEIRNALIQAVRFKFMSTYINYIRNYSETTARGMSWWFDKIDWIGGLPFEVAMPEEIFEHYRCLNFELLKLKTRRGGHGCCEYVFRHTMCN